MKPAELVEAALKLSTADGCVVLVEVVDRANIRWANNTLTTNGVTNGQRVTVISAVAGGAGTAAGVLSRAGVDEHTLGELVRASEAAARSAGPVPDAQPLVGGDAADGWDEAPEHTSIGIFGDVAPALGEAFGAAKAANNLLFGFAEHEMKTTYLGTSAGLRRRHVQPTGALNLNAKSSDFARSAYLAIPTADFVGVDLVSGGEDLAGRLGWAKRRVELPAGRYETLLPPDAVADLITYAHYAGGSARDAAEGRSVYSRPGGGTRIGDQLCGDTIRVTLSSDPYAAGIACAPFVMAHANNELESVFDDGLALSPTEWINDGILSSLITTRHSAAQNDLPVTPFIDNLTMRASTGGSNATIAEMVANTERGLLLTCVWYVRPVDQQSMLLTGLTRDGVYLVEDGEVTGAVNNFRFNESPVELLHRIEEAGRSERCLGREFGEYFNRAEMPALRIGDFNMSSVSQAA
jgi:predicted Zn-dependent protease